MGTAAGAMARAGTALAAWPLVVLLAAPASATAWHAEPATRGEADTAPFGALGSVGVLAIALGLIGMLAGVVRQHRRAGPAESELPGEQETTRPLTPVDTHR